MARPAVRGAYEGLRQGNVRVCKHHVAIKFMQLIALENTDKLSSSSSECAGSVKARRSCVQAPLISYITGNNYTNA